MITLIVIILIKVTIIFFNKLELGKWKKIKKFFVINKEIKNIMIEFDVWIYKKKFYYQ